VLVRRHIDALAQIARTHGERIGVFAEGLGGFVAFYVALAHGPMKSLVCMNSPALLDEPAFQNAVFHEDAQQGWKRRALVPLLSRLGRWTPNLPIPIRFFLDFRKMLDPVEPSHTFERKLIDAYLSDPGFDRSYPLAAVLSLISTPPPNPLAQLRTPTLFIVPKRGFAPDYERALCDRLPPIGKKLVEVDGSVFWMVSHPTDAAQLVCDWIAETLAASG
jgi:pimeloyl-ACP methyl ester carboxylesterase